MGIGVGCTGGGVGTVGCTGAGSVFTVCGGVQSCQSSSAVIPVPSGIVSSLGTIVLSSLYSRIICSRLLTILPAGSISSPRAFTFILPIAGAVSFASNNAPKSTLLPLDVLYVLPGFLAILVS